MALHRNLKSVVDWVWLNRIGLLEQARKTGLPLGRMHYDPHNVAVNSIYGYICGIVQGKKVENRDMVMFGRTLCRKLQNKLPTPVEYWLQRNGISRLNSLNDFPEPETWVSAFIHFIKPNRYTCMERVYLNLREATRATAFSDILKLIWHLDGVMCAKVAAPGRNKADTALVYCSNRDARDEVLSIVSTYQKRHLKYFGSQLPKLVATERMGIGYGSEPPIIRPRRPNSQRFEAVHSDTQSFNTYRATLIFIALERTLRAAGEAPPDPRRAGIDLRVKPNTNQRRNLDAMWERHVNKVNAVHAMGQKQDFERRVEEIFRLAGIDPQHPELQNDPILSAPPPPPECPPV